MAGLKGSLALLVTMYAGLQRSVGANEVNSELRREGLSKSKEGVLAHSFLNDQMVEPYSLWLNQGSLNLLAG